MEFSSPNGRLPPGFRFHPTDVELIMHYLKRKLLGKRLEPELVAEVDIYQFHPADLRELACLNKDLNWYFFCARGKKYGSGDRTNRATESGYWKATGKDRAVLYRERTIGKVKTLVFHIGRPPKGERTDWVMHEYRLEDTELANRCVCDAFVLCKIFKKGGWGPRNGEQYGAPYNEEEWNMDEQVEIPNDAVTTYVAAQDITASGVTNPAMIEDLVSPLEQIYSCDVSVSAVDQALTPDLTASGAEQIHSCDASVSGVDQALTPTSDAANIASTSKNDVPNHDEALELAPDTIPTAATDVVPSLQDPVPQYADEMWCVDDFIEIYDNLEDVLTYVNDMWSAADYSGKCDNFEDLGMEFDDLMALLGP